MNKAPPRLRDYTHRNVGVRIWGVALFVFAVAAVVAWSYLPPPLPKVVRLGTGPSDGYYARFAEALRKEVAKHGIKLETVATAGSMENIGLLLDGSIDVGLVQSGNLNDEQAAKLTSIASVFYEPVLIVTRADWTSGHIEGGRIAIGAPGSGAHAVARELLEDQGVRDGDPPGTELVEIGRQRAVQALSTGQVDSGIFVTSLEAPWVRTLFVDPGLRVVNLALAEAFTRHYRYLKPIAIPAGLIDLRSEIPPKDVQAIATTTSLVIRPDAHRALIPLLIESARGQLYQGSLLAEPGEFPSAHGVEAPLAEEALQYFERGPSFFYRWLPFQYAFVATRLTIVLIPLLTLLYPLFRLAGPTYSWVVRRRVYRWYRVLERIEEKMDESAGAASLHRIHDELERVGDQIRNTHVPASYRANLFALRVHHQLLVDRLASLTANS
jgi:TRAP transporter TAXI family solute receptor